MGGAITNKKRTSALVSQRVFRGAMITDRWLLLLSPSKVSSYMLLVCGKNLCGAKKQVFLRLEYHVTVLFSRYMIVTISKTDIFIS